MFPLNQFRKECCVTLSLFNSFYQQCSDFNLDGCCYLRFVSAHRNPSIWCLQLKYFYSMLTKSVLLKNKLVHVGSILFHMYCRIIFSTSQ